MPLSRLGDRKSTRLNSSHEWISYAVFCLKKKKKGQQQGPHEKTIHVDISQEHDFVVACLGEVEVRADAGVTFGDDGLDLDFFFNDTATTEIYTLSLHDALPI